jgi:hypothetical protein
VTLKQSDCVQDRKATANALDPFQTRDCRTKRLQETAGQRDLTLMQAAPRKATCQSRIAPLGEMVGRIDSNDPTQPCHARHDNRVPAFRPRRGRAPCQATLAALSSLNVRPEQNAGGVVSVTDQDRSPPKALGRKKNYNYRSWQFITPTTL